MMTATKTDFGRKKLRDAKAIGFDWSGTVSDDVVAVYLAVCITWKSLGIEVFERDPIAWGMRSVGSAMSDLKHRADVARISGDAELAEKLERITPDQYDRIYGEALRVVVEGRGRGATGKVVPTPIQGVVPALKRLRAAVGPDFSISVISAHPAPMIAKDVDRYGLGGDVFDDIVGDCRDKATVIGEFAAWHSHEPGTVIYVGDTIGDIRAAKRAGVISVGVTSGYHGSSIVTDCHPDATFGCAEDFIDRFLLERSGQ
jgi:phosphoglycolate phosphatase-like HAD superfamily hydrolase